MVPPSGGFGGAQVFSLFLSLSLARNMGVNNGGWQRELGCRKVAFFLVSLVIWSSRHSPIPSSASSAAVAETLAASGGGSVGGGKRS
jgi:hypothetical protein